MAAVSCSLFSSLLQVISYYLWESIGILEWCIDVMLMVIGCEYYLILILCRVTGTSNGFVTRVHDFFFSNMVVSLLRQMCGFSVFIIFSHGKNFTKYTEL